MKTNTLFVFFQFFFFFVDACVFLLRYYNFYYTFYYKINGIMCFNSNLTEITDDNGRGFLKIYDRESIGGYIFIL